MLELECIKINKYYGDWSYLLNLQLSCCFRFNVLIVLSQLPLQPRSYLFKLSILVSKISLFRHFAMLSTASLTILHVLLHFVVQVYGQVHFTDTSWDGITVGQGFIVTLSSSPRILYKWLTTNFSDGAEMAL